MADVAERRAPVVGTWLDRRPPDRTLRVCFPLPGALAGRMRYLELAAPSDITIDEWAWLDEYVRGYLRLAGASEQSSARADHEPPERGQGGE